MSFCAINRSSGAEEFDDHPRLRLMCNEGGVSRPHCLAKMTSACDLSVNHRYDSQRAGIHDEDLIADLDVFIAAILRGIFHDRNRQAVKMHCSWKRLAELG